MTDQVRRGEREEVIMESPEDTEKRKAEAVL